MSKRQKEQHSASVSRDECCSKRTCRRSHCPDWMEALQDDVFTTVGLTAGVDTEGKVAGGQGGGPMGGRMGTEEQEVLGGAHHQTGRSVGKEGGAFQAREIFNVDNYIYDGAKTKTIGASSRAAGSSAKNSNLRGDGAESEAELSGGGMERRLCGGCNAPRARVEFSEQE